MKTKFLFTAALAAMAFTSCQKDGVGQDMVLPGQDTYIGMTIQLPKSAAVRSFQGDVNATEAESKLTSVTVGVWSDGDGAVTYTDLIVSELTNNNDGTYTATKAVKAKTGTNNIIVIANSAAKLTPTQINGAAFDETVASVATVDNFVMYSDAVTVLSGVVLASKAEVEVGIATNRATITLSRAAAKVAVTSSLAATDATGVDDGLGNGKLTNIVWNIANQNAQMTVFPKFVTGTDFIASNVNSPFTRLATVAPTMVLPATGADASVAYCLENAHGGDVYRENNTTAVQISATFAPGILRYVSEITGTNATNAVIVHGATAMIAGTTFYVSKKDVGTQTTGAFFAEAAVDNAVTIFGMDKADDFTEYVNGKCFWPIWINNGVINNPSYGVLRNHMYTMNITGIKAPGFPSFPDTDNPINTVTVAADVTVLYWNTTLIKPIL